MKAIPKTAVVLVAGGSGVRFGAEQPKQFLALGDKKVIDYSMELFSKLDNFEEKVLVLPQAFVEEWSVTFRNQWICVKGGSTRQNSVSQGLKALSPSIEKVLIHDAARPLLSEEVLTAALRASLKFKAVVVAIPLADTLKKADLEQRVIETIPRDQLYQVQTPQIFDRSLLEKALEWAEKENFQGTDEATLVEKIGGEVGLSLGSVLNFKITRGEDLELAQAILASRIKD